MDLQPRKTKVTHVPYRELKGSKFGRERKEEKKNCYSSTPRQHNPGSPLSLFAGITAFHLEAKKASGHCK
jgi:hypothetical protein